MIFNKIKNHLPALCKNGKYISIKFENERINELTGLLKDHIQNFLYVGLPNEIYIDLSNIDFIVNNQKINGLWKANDENAKNIITEYKSWNEFMKKNKGKLESLFKMINKINEDIFMTMFVIGFIENLPNGEQNKFKLIIEKAKKAIMKLTSEYNPKIQEEFNKLILLN